MNLFYNISIYSYLLTIKIASLFNRKAKLWVQGRRNLIQRIQSTINSNDEIYWFHCASLGEYEQGKPLIEKLKAKNPSLKILVTFFSPSGYENRKNEALIDYCYYLPFDSKKNAKRFIEVVNPKKVFFIKYEFWFYYLQELSNKNISTYLVSGVFRKEQLFFKWYGTTHKKMLGFFTHYFLQNKSSEKLLNQLGYKNITITGDTRIDRVYENSLKPAKLPLIEKFRGNNKVIVTGSSWEQEEKIICDYIKSSDKEFKYIIAPHDVSIKRIKSIEKLLDESNYIKYSEANDENIVQYTILIIDNIGILANTYHYTDIAFIGGGFKGALHNVLEPASFGNVVLFGKKHSKFHEAEELLSNHAAFEISYTDDLIAVVNHLLIENNLEQTQTAAKKYIKNGIGASDKIIEVINQKKQ